MHLTSKIHYITLCNKKEQSVEHTSSAQAVASSVQGVPNGVQGVSK